ncbi:serine--tRNA ligase [Pseudobdellovibrio exovorus]|uniref:Serine--tRNA ligase n=1 Tax=Pseudobdellovibrio exovorus JSS TaxID=1184267 RepID=M4VMJ7_9BACT|nr:serine--tRNA ligase [Pseudobdellovibrio exovorus]AGH94309.1 seryl-tRNA synthetase [Pseudobdellovibrio exovorus JSS]
MIDLKQLERKAENGQNYYEDYKQGLINRGASTEVLEKIMSLGAKRREALTQAETEKAKQNKLSAEVGKLKREGGDASAVLAEVEQLKQKVKDLEQNATAVDAEVQELLMTIPNKPHSSVPVGKSEHDNKIVAVVGEPTKFSFKAKEHFEIGEKLGIIDFDRAGKTTGARFTFLKGAAAQMERALIQFMMDVQSTQHGYTEMIPPFIVNSKSLTGTGQFPKFKEDVFHLDNTDYYLIPTAEVPVTNYYNDETLNEADLPQSFCAYSPCFRSEAGSYGKDTKGLIRQHQFNKVELMTFCHPSQSYEVHEQLTSHAEKILQLLELPYRKMLLCTGDMGFGSAKTYDLEVWLPGQNAYREISSCSNFEDFQARRANIRFKPKDGGKPQFVHTLNGSGLAVGRTLVAILENYQREDGSVAIPKALQNYMGGKTEM